MTRKLILAAAVAVLCFPGAAFAHGSYAHRWFARRSFAYRSVAYRPYVYGSFAHGPAARASFAPALSSAAAEPAPAPAGGDLIAEARRWLGSPNMTGQRGPWCADAISFWLRRTGRPPLANRMAAAALAYGPRLPGPKVGALAVVHTRAGFYGHVGLVEGVEPNGSIRVISGNWGGRVADAVISRAQVVAFVEAH